MVRKKIKAHVNGYDSMSAFQIDALNGILEKFCTEDGFEDFCEKNSVIIQVGSDRVDLGFDPRTWEAAERFIWYAVCHLIESSDSLDKIPTYKKMADRYAAALGEERGTFQ